MSSIQERLQMKRVPIDKWSIREQLCLASAVACSGDQNWMSVSRSLKVLCGNDRPSDWFSQKSCAAQYGKLLENVETPKRKKRTEKDTVPTSVETPVEIILRRLKQERVAELHRMIEDDRKEYNRIKDWITTAQNCADEGKLREIWTQIEIEKKQDEKEAQKHAQWLKEREERKIEMERAWRPTGLNLYQQSSPGQSPSKAGQLNIKIKPEDPDPEDYGSRQGTSPLLTSLLKSPSPAPNPINPILHTSLSAGPNATRVSAPTITNLLTGSVSSISTANLTSPLIFTAQLQKQPLTGPAPIIISSDPIHQSPSQAAPTLSMLLENKQQSSLGPQQQLQQQKMPPLIRIDAQLAQRQPDQSHSASVVDVAQAAVSSSGLVEMTPKNEPDDSPMKDDDQHLMEVFNGLIPDNIDELANILTENNAIILNPELLAEDAILQHVDELIGVADDDDDEEDEAELQPPASTTAELPTIAERTESDSVTIADDIVLVPDEETDPPTIPTIFGSEVGGSHSVEHKLMADTATSNEIALSPGDTQSSDPVVLIHDDDNSDFSNDTPLAKLIQSGSTPKTDKKNAGRDDEVVAACGGLKKEEPDNFESDSNDDKCLESIKREIRGLTGLKENSDNSNEETEKLDRPLSVNVDAAAANDSEQPTLIEDSPNDVTDMKEEILDIEESPPPETINISEPIDDTNAQPVKQPDPEPIAIVEPNIDDDIVEIKDDKSEDDKPDPVIIIEETDDAISEETASDDVKIEHVGGAKVDTDPIKKSTNAKERMSIDEEFFDDSKADQDDTTSKCADDDTQSGGPKSDDNTITIIDTDEDTTTDVIKTEEKPKNKRDYSRRKQDLSAGLEKRQDESAGGGSGAAAAAAATTTTAAMDESKSLVGVRMKLKERERSESPFVDEDGNESPSPAQIRRRYSSTLIDSLPNSPASSDDREFKVWKKNILLVYSRLASSKCASIFSKPITDDQAPGYKTIILRPMDLQTIKRNLDSGLIRTTAEFQRDVKLMCYNAIMYNSDDKVTQQMAEEFQSTATKFIQALIDTWKRETEKPTTSSSGGGLKYVRGRKSPRLPVV